MPEDQTGSPTPPKEHAPKVEPADQAGQPLERWQESLRAVRGAAEASMAELEALRRDVAGALRSMRRAEAWDPERTEEEVSALATHLERVQDRLAARLDDLRRTVDEASAAAVSSVRRLGRMYQRIRNESEISQELYDRLSGLERAVERVAELNGGQSPAAALADLREAVGDIRLDLKEAAGPTQAVLEARLAEMQASLQASVERLGARLTRRLKNLQGPEAPTTTGREVTAATQALRKDMEAFRKRIEGWGKPRTAPRLAEEVAALERRFEDLEGAVREALAGEVAKRVRSAVDRRLARLLEDLPDLIREAVAAAGDDHPAAEPSPRDPPSEETPDWTALREPAVMAPEPWETRRRGRFRRWPR